MEGSSGAEKKTPPELEKPRCKYGRESAGGALIMIESSIMISSWMRNSPSLVLNVPFARPLLVRFIPAPITARCCTLLLHADAKG